MGLFRIGGTHHFAIFGDRTLALQDLDHHGTGYHETHQILEKRPLAVDLIEALGFGLRKLHHARRDDLETGRFEALVDFTDQISADAVRFDD